MRIPDHVGRATSVPERAGNCGRQRSPTGNTNSLLPGRLQVDPARNHLLSAGHRGPVAGRGTPVRAGAVRFFRKSPALRLSPRRVHHPWNPPEAELPGIVPVDTLHFDRSEQAAVAIIGIVAYARGFEFVVARRIRPGTPGLDEELTPEMRRRMLTEQDPFQISLRFSDGRRAISSRRAPGDSEPTGPILQPRGGGGTSHSQLVRWWAWPLPRPGRWSSSASGRCTGSAKQRSASTRNSSSTPPAEASSYGQKMTRTPPHRPQGYTRDDLGWDVLENRRHRTASNVQRQSTATRPHSGCQSLSCTSAPT